MPFPASVTSSLVSSPESSVAPAQAREKEVLRTGWLRREAHFLSWTLGWDVCALGVGQIQGPRHCHLQGMTWASTHHL